MKNTTVLISGAGIAGTALAYWLHRHGFRPTVVERAAAIRDGGYKIDVRGAALEVARRTGILDDIRALTTDVRIGSVVNAGGRRVASMNGDTFGGREHGDAEILRGDLNRMLFDVTKNDVEYLFAESITELKDTGEGVEVTFTSGATRTFDLVVGADGLHSGTRARIFGDERRSLHDLGYRVSIFSVPNHLGLNREELTYVSPGHTVLMYSTARDTGAKAMFLFADDAPLPEDGRAHLADVYATEGWEVPKLLESCAQAPDFYLDSLSQVHLDHWSRGRVALVGDAAYAASTASGQGTSLALVGAYVLAGELAAAGDHEAGFAAYERKVRPFVEQNQKLGPANIKRMVLASKTQVWLSMTFLSLLSKLPGRDRLLAKAIEPIHRAANAIALDDY